MIPNVREIIAKAARMKEMIPLTYLHQRISCADGDRSMRKISKGQNPSSGENVPVIMQDTATGSSPSIRKKIVGLLFGNRSDELGFLTRNFIQKDLLGEW